MQLILEIPEKYSFFQSSDELAHILKLNTAIELYRKGHLSASAAAEFVGHINRDEFLYECRQRNIEPQTYENIEELENEVDMLGKALS